MIFKELLEKFDDKDIIKKIVKLYPDQKKNIEGYVRALDELRTTKPKKTDLSILLTLEKAKDDPLYEKGDKDWVSITGKCSTDSERYAIDLTSWRLWLSMPILQESLDNFSELDILARCVWEMTYHGYSQRQVQKAWNKIKVSVEELENSLVDKE